MKEKLQPPAALCRMFTIDLRSLAVFRISLAGVLLVDLISRWRNIRMLYTDEGMLPRPGLLQVYGESIKWTSLHYHTAGSVALQSMMFAIAVLVATALLVGYRTWIATLVSWLLLISLNRYMPHAVGSGGDIIMRVLLFWSLFLPLSARWSVDASRTDSVHIKSNRLCTVATAVLLLQVCYVYWFTAIWKIHPDWLGGESVAYAMRLDIYRRPLATWVAGNHELTVVLTYASLLLEVLVPFIALSPWFSAAGRWAAVLSMWGFHLGIALCMDIGMFPYVSMMSWIPFIPGSSWDALFAWMRPTAPVLPPDRSSEEASHGSASPQHGSSFLPPRPPKIQLSTAGSILVGGLFLFVTVYNVLGLEQLQSRGFRLPRSVEIAAKALRLDQKWEMFAPTPNALDGWFVMPAVLADGSIVDIWRAGKPVTYQKPARPWDACPDDYVKKFLVAHRARPNSDVWPWVARYFAREWNAGHSPDRAVTRLQITFIAEVEHDGETYLTSMIEYDARLDAAVALSPTPFGA